MSIFRQPFTVKRFYENTIIKGVFTKGSLKETFIIQASKQPLSAEQTELLPEGRKERASLVFFTDTELYTVERGTQQSPDIILVGTDEYEVLTNSIWENNIINHKKYIAQKITK